MKTEEFKVSTHSQNPAAVAHWQSKLLSAIPLDIPTDHSRGSKISRSISYVPITFDIEKIKQLTVLASSHRVDLQTVFLATFNVLLQRYCGQDDVCVGTLNSNPNLMQKNALGQIGLSISRNIVSSVRTFSDTLVDVWKSSQESESYALPFDKISKAIEITDFSSVAEFFRAIFSFSNQHDLDFDLKKEIDLFTFDLFLSLVNLNDGTLKGYIYFSKDLFEESSVLRIRDHYSNLLKSIVSEPEERVGRLQILSCDEYDQILYQWNKTSALYSSHSCIQNLFEAQVAKSPLATAIIFADEKITYYDLNARANKLARYLIMQDVHKGALVGICLDRSVEMVICLLAVLKSGAAYVPLDPEYPDIRIEQMIHESRMSIVLTNTNVLDRKKIVAGHIACIDNAITADQISMQSEKNIGSELRRVHSSDLAYVIFTSGSTGTPKGVMVEHRGLINLYEWYASCVYSSFDERNLLVSSLSFDLTQKNIFSTLLHGHVLVIPKIRYFDRDRIIECAQKNDITLINCAPSTWKILYDSDVQHRFPKLRSLVLGGEPLDSLNFGELFSTHPQLKVFNSYGPTECSDVSAYFKMDAAHQKTAKTPIGKGIPNTLHYILDDQLQPVPVGVVGELYIGGVGVARGYLNKPELTSEKFFPNPFEDGERNLIYRTSDLCKYLPSGDIEFVGRKDQQIKIRGNRIELGEIESALLNHPETQDAVVLCKEVISQEKHLVAFLVLKNDFDINLFREYLKNSLPDFMIPSYFVAIDKIPVTQNGKIDKNILLNLDVISPRNILEEMTLMQKEVCKVFTKYLGFKNISLDDDLFAIGGDSIMVVQIFSEINKEFGVGIGVDKIFSSEHITIRWLTDLVEKCQIEAIGIDSYDLLLKQVESMTDEQVQNLLSDINQ